MTSPRSARDAKRIVVVSPHLDDGVLSLGAAIASWTRGGDRVEVLHEVDEWAFVSFWREIDDREQTGWVSSRYIGNADDVPAPANTAALAEPEA